MITTEMLIASILIAPLAVTLTVLTATFLRAGLIDLYEMLSKKQEEQETAETDETPPKVAFGSNEEEFEEDKSL